MAATSFLTNANLSEILSTGDSLLGDPTKSSLLQGSTDPISTVASPLSGTDELLSDPTSSTAVTNAANSAILGLHSGIEGTADANGLVGSLHGLTGTGEALGLGHIGQQNIVTDAFSAPTSLLSGEVPSLPLANDAAPVVIATEAMGTGTLSDLGANPALVAPVTATATAATMSLDPTSVSTESMLNAPIMAFHTALETGADLDGTSGTVHGVTNLGETVGLGELGGDNP